MDDSDSDYPERGSENGSESDVDEFYGFNEFAAIMGNQQVVVAETDRHTMSSVNAEEEDATEQLFNEDLPLEHLYLGQHLEVVSGRVILSEGSGVTIPLLSRVSCTLIPGQTFPLTVRDYPRMEMLRKCVSSDHTFGCIATSYHRIVAKGPLYGTTAEIYEFSDNSDQINVKAKARQRFKVIKTKRVDAGYLVGYVEILPEVNLGNPLIQVQPLARFRRSRRDWCRRREALLTAWPSWVYDMYDPERLIQRVNTELAFLNQGLRKETGKGNVMPTEASQLSFWVATHLDAEGRMFLITLNSPIQRLRWQLNTMTKCQQYVCQSCQNHIAYQSDMFAMSGEGAQSTYVNPNGTQHDTLTFRTASNITLVTSLSTEFSWFPGYAWSVGVCATCNRHIGWQFVSTNKRLKPHKFWGLTRHSLEAKINKDIESNLNII